MVHGVSLPFEVHGGMLVWRGVIHLRASIQGCIVELMGQPHIVTFLQPTFLGQCDGNGRCRFPCFFMSSNQQTDSEDKTASATKSRMG